VRTRRHAGRSFRGGEAGPDRETAAERLCERTSRPAVTPRRFVGEQIAGAAHTGLHLVEDQQHAIVVAELPQRLEE